MSKIITQKYTSVDQIDPEFINPLEQLLEENVPNFDYIRKSERLSDDKTHFNYFLFFGQLTNAPIGFAQVKIIKDAPKKEKIFTKIFSRKKINREINENSAHWRIPGAIGEGIVFNPKYSNYVGEKTYQVFKEILEREDIYAENLCFSEAYQSSLLSADRIASSDHSENVVIDSLIKNKANYQDYLKGLSEKTRKEIMNTWKFVQRELNYRMGEYSSLKEVFQYKEKGAEQLKKIKADKKVDLYNLQDAKITYLSFETNHEVKSVGIFIQGNGIHSFYDIFHFDDQLPEIIPHQQILIHFFEQNQSSKLHYLGSELEQEYLLKLGFTYKKQHIISVKKDVK